ncbi:unnamed protein product [Orchesella dallaii]|uniref:Uncharacterized protein n=1 Tax=Orchesella dallaii TaxID=48710 RepID=A0ABP1PXE3_9HEXA
MRKKVFSIPGAFLLSSVTLLLFITKEGKCDHEEDFSALKQLRRPEDNGEFEMYFISPGGKRIGCSGLFGLEGREEVASIFVEDHRGRQRISTATLSSQLRFGVFPSITAMLETIKRFAFLPVLCLMPFLHPIANILGIQLEMDLLNMDKLLSLNFNGSVGVGVDANVSFVCPRGPPGPPGRAGYPGPIGPLGPAGPDGLNGTDGAPGLIGIPGEVGPQGPDGIQGPQGLPGPQGALGPQGDQGDVGRDGRDGLPGAAGPSGAPGADGVDGIDGQDGRDGREGHKGAPGRQGEQGLPGQPGLPGTPGPNGKPGTSGWSGRPGLNGLPGTNGADAICPIQFGGASGVSNAPASDGCSFIELNQNKLTKGAVTIGGGGGGGGGDTDSGPGGSGGSAQGVGIADAGSTGLGFYICNSKNLTFTITVDNNSDRITINESKQAEDQFGNKITSFDEFTRESVGKLKVDVNAEGEISIVPLGNTDKHWTFTRHSGVRPSASSNYPIF